MSAGLYGIPIGIYADRVDFLLKKVRPRGFLTSAVLLKDQQLVMSARDPFTSTSTVSKLSKDGHLEPVAIQGLSCAEIPAFWPNEDASDVGLLCVHRNTADDQTHYTEFLVLDAVNSPRIIELR